MKISFLTLLVVVAGTGVHAAESLTWVDLVGRLTDLEYLATLPRPGERCAQWSSYNRATRYDPEVGYVGWNFNGDAADFIREEGGLQVLAEMNGPGVIWRIWSAEPKDGRIKVVLDGAEKPAIDLPFKQFFDGSTAPFDRENLCYVAANGHNCFVPIPFQRSCKIVAEPGWGRFYHFTYGLFPDGTSVPTFRMALSSEANAALDRANGIFGRLGVDPAAPRKGERTERCNVNIEAGRVGTVLDLPGPRAITALRMRIELPEEQEKQLEILRSLALSVTWDEEERPAVWAPLGDFFGAIAVLPYRSFPLGVLEGEEEEWYALWYMPFARRARIELANDGREARSVRFEITHAPLDRPIKQLGRFHAKWHRNFMLPKEPERWIDWPMLVAGGRGRYVGVMLHVWNPGGGWWGEGDEKLFVDGERFPSTIGTGSEDYFGFAWSSGSYFEKPFHSQPLRTTNRGHACVGRFHVADQVPFQTGFEASIEKYRKDDTGTLYAATAYWYAAPGGEDPYPAQPIDQRVGYWDRVEIMRVAGAIEGEALRVLKHTGGNVIKQSLHHFSAEWSAQEQLWWFDGEPGDRLDLAIPKQQEGRYRLWIALTKARDYGVIQPLLDNKPLGAPIDLYNPAVVPTGPIDLGVVNLGEGPATLSLEITGANPKAVKRHRMGLDYIKFVPVNDPGGKNGGNGCSVPATSAPPEHVAID